MVGVFFPKSIDITDAGRSLFRRLLRFESLTSTHSAEDIFDGIEVFFGTSLELTFYIFLIRFL